MSIRRAIKITRLKKFLIVCIPKNSSVSNKIVARINYSRAKFNDLLFYYILTLHFSFLIVVVICLLSVASVH